MFFREEIARVPVRGIRQRLRIVLRREGFLGKFETAHLRHDRGQTGPCLVVIPKSGQTTLPVLEFEGMNVYLRPP